ncbi:MAG: prolipoprotein diacylglyceryl transferase [Saprospiraceae bacterium]
MYPDLSYFFHDLFGTPPDNWTSIFKTFGLFLVLAILSSAYFLYIELKRKATLGFFQPEKVKVIEGKPATSGEYISNTVFGFILGFKLLYIAQNFPEFQADPAGVVLSGLGSWLGGLLGAAAFAGLKYWESKRKELPKPKERIDEVYPHHRIGDITIIAAISGVAGAKIFDVLEHLPDFFRDPIGTLLSGGGLAIYGGLIIGFISVFLYLKRKNIPVLHVMDAVAPALIIGYGVGRLGCQFSGDGDWGIVAAAQPSWWFLPDWLWAYDYPRNVLNEGVPIEGCTWEYCNRLEPAVYPTPIYETIFSFLIAGILWALRKRLEVIPGMLFFVYLILNGIERFWVESIRVNIRYNFLGLQPTQAEVIAIALIVIGILGCVILWRRSRSQNVQS